jgi:hypothetical protein
MAKKTVEPIEVVDKSNREPDKVEADPNARGKWEENRSKLRATLKNYNEKFWKKTIN